MTGESTSLASPQSLRGEWTQFSSFVSKAKLPDQRSSSLSIGTSAVLRMLSLDLAAMSVLLVIAGIVALIGVEIPETALAGIEIGWEIVFFVIVVAPVLEELVFRSWLSGRPRYLVAIPIVLIAGIVAAMVGVNTTGDAAQAGVGFVMLGAILLYVITAALLWKRETPGWFRTIFPALFWLSTIGFAAIHLLNFNEGNWLSLLPLILPQLILGMMLGYLRVNYGLWTAIALHMIHNGLIIGIVLAASASGGPA